MIALSILIPTFSRDAHLLPSLRTELIRQAEKCPEPCEFLIDSHETDCIGLKRNRLLTQSKGAYIAFVDSDDKLSPNYLSLLLEGINTKDREGASPDACSLKGIITWDGKNPEIFEHSIKYKEWKTNPNARKHQIKYERYPNHLNCIRADIAKQFAFPEKSYGEDFDWSMKVHCSGLIKTEHYIDEVLYYYHYKMNK